jgi:hypothetical protein
VRRYKWATLEQLETETKARASVFDAMGLMLIALGGCFARNNNWTVSGDTIARINLEHTDF